MTIEHPILYTADSIRAYLEDRKTQTRRVIKPQPIIDVMPDDSGKLSGHWRVKPSETLIWAGYNHLYMITDEMMRHSPYGQAGDRLWVRETWEVKSCDGLQADIAYKADPYGHDTQIVYICDKKLPKNLDQWQPSIFMPRWASRLTQTITEVRVERLQEINTNDKALQAEGIPLICQPDNRTDWLEMAYQFSLLWDSLNAKRGYSWESNPWVWVISYPTYSEEPTRTGNA